MLSLSEIKLFGHKNNEVLVFISILSLVTVASAGIGLRLPISIPFLSFHRPSASSIRPPRQNHLHQPLNHLHHNAAPHKHAHPLDHVHQDQEGRFYFHDPDSTVKFYYKEYLSGPSNRVDVHDDGCREVPMDYWHNRPKSIWAKHCITLYQSGHCKGEGIQVAGMIAELRSVGMHYGVNSFKPCEKNIRVRFMPTASHNHHHHHHHVDHHHKTVANQIQEIQLH